MCMKISGLIIGFFAVTAWCCASPGNLEGVAFTSGETLHVETLMKLGTENVNYFKDGNDTAIGIRDISHYDARAMVFVGTYGMSYQQNLPLNCMGVIFPIDSAFQRIDTNVFDFAAAIKTELEWLVARNAVALSAATLFRIDSALSKSSNGGVQYWTHAGTVLGYNSWYSYDTLKGVWGGFDGVRGVNGVKGCSLINPDTGLPPQQLGGTGIHVDRRNGIPTSGFTMTINQRKNGGILIHFSRPLGTAGELTVMNCRGEAVARMIIPSGARSCSVEPYLINTPGYYSAELKSSKCISGSSFLIVK
jgi:hypothetical protein